MRVLVVAVVLLWSGLSSAQNKPAVVVEASSPPTVPMANSATPEQVWEFFAVTHLDTAMKRLMSQMLSAMKSTAAPYLTASFWEDMDSTMTKYDFMSELVPIYQKHLTRDDMAAVLTFYRSEAGKHLLENQASMTTDAQETFRQIGERLGGEVGERHSDEIMAAKKKYEEGIANKQNLNLTPDPK